MSWPEQLKAHCAAKENAWEDHPWDHCVYKIGKKLFAIVGENEPTHITLKAAPDDLDALLTVPFIERAAYVGRYGWITATVSDEESLEMVLDLIDTSYTTVRRKQRRRSGAGAA